MKILVVDDDDEVTSFFCSFLKHLGLEAKSANSAKEAIKLFYTYQPDWLFLDINMPHMDGLTLFKRLKEIEPQIKVIMITGRDDQESFNKAKELGAIDYIVKPLELEALHKTIKNYIIKE